MDFGQATPRWWQRAVAYQIYPRSFADSDGNGVGDLNGIRRHLDHLTWLGVEAIWISPFYTSPMADFGYDVADFRDVDPIFGTLDDFDRLLNEAHRRGLRVLIDWVPNHTSDQHPWFVESRSSRTNPKRDWYVWRDRPNNWKANFGGNAWTFDPGTGQWYLHSFLPRQPDLNWANPDVAEAMLETLRFWLDRGVDGFRVDAVRRLGKNPEFVDNPPNPDAGPDTPEFFTQLHVHSLGHPRVHPILRRVREFVDQYPGDRVLVGEVYYLTAREIAPYFGEGDELHLCFLFPLLHAPWDAAAWRAVLDEVAEEFDAIGAWPAWCLSNHDNPRQLTRYGSEDRARAAAVALLTLRGTPFIYAGEELGLEDAVVPPDRVVDPGGRDGPRAPIPWTREADHGWPGAEPWLPWPPDAEYCNVETQRDLPGSMLHLYRRLIAARKASRALREGDWIPLPAPPGALAYERSTGPGDRRTVVINFTGEPLAVPLAGRWRVEIASDGQGEGSDYSGVVPPDTGLLLW